MRCPDDDVPDGIYGRHNDKQTFMKTIGLRMCSQRDKQMRTKKFPNEVSNLHLIGSERQFLELFRFTYLPWVHTPTTPKWRLPLFFSNRLRGVGWGCAKGFWETSSSDQEPLSIKRHQSWGNHSPISQTFPSPPPQRKLIIQYFCVTCGQCFNPITSYRFKY